ncbi:MAG TPA: hypothetical protein VGR06_32025 [Actinophytocola sp.]|jgi:hypothetical protein|uniref:hypothetical protein n=1 Tax=Actinophytocola sp. TaxID=1872138 RepID=UPI002DFF2332|nr:hypothetical protein [Actinophytocola sp.]
MLTPHNDHLISLLASLGFATDSPEEIVIDDFDQWTNPEAAVVYGTCASGATVERWTEVAA